MILQIQPSICKLLAHNLQTPIWLVVLDIVAFLWFGKKFQFLNISTFQSDRQSQNNNFDVFRR